LVARVRCPDEVVPKRLSASRRRLMRTETSWGLVCLERDGLTSRLFETLKSEHSDERATAWRCV
jgi:hypothetical protein